MTVGPDGSVDLAGWLGRETLGADSSVNLKTAGRMAQSFYLTTGALIIGQKNALFALFHEVFPDLLQSFML